MARIALNGIEIDYAVTGRGRSVILSHGYGATRRMWDAGGLGAVIWMAMLGASAYAIYSVWRAYTSY